MFTTPKRRFKPEEIQEIRKEYYINLSSLSTISKRFSSSKAMIQKIVNYETYKDVKNPKEITKEVIESRKPYRERYPMHYKRRF